MRDTDEPDPKKPHSVRTLKKRTNPLEGEEGQPWRPIDDEDRDCHRHV